MGLFCCFGVLLNVDKSAEVTTNQMQVVSSFLVFRHIFLFDKDKDKDTHTHKYMILRNKANNVVGSNHLVFCKTSKC